MPLAVRGVVKARAKAAAEDEVAVAPQRLARAATAKPTAKANDDAASGGCHKGKDGLFKHEDKKEQDKPKSPHSQKGGGRGNKGGKGQG